MSGVLALTGAANGIGRGMARYFASRGWTLSLADTDERGGAAVLDEVRALGARAQFTGADVADAGDVARWMDATVATFGAPALTINNAGIDYRVPFLELAPADFDRVLGVNLRGTMLCSQAAARAMIAATVRGTIVNVASSRAFMSEPDTESYTASKGGIVALTHALAISLGPHRIRVNCVCPGWIETPRIPAKTSEDREQHPVGRVGTPDDVAHACLYLHEAGFVTGQHLIVDGGMTVKMIYAE